MITFLPCIQGPEPVGKGCQQETCRFDPHVGQSGEKCCFDGKKSKNRPHISRTRLIGVVAGSAHPFPKGFSQLTGSSDQNGVNFPPNPSKLPEMLVKNGVFMHDNGRKGPWSD